MAELVSEQTQGERENRIGQPFLGNTAKNVLGRSIEIENLIKDKPIIYQINAPTIIYPEHYAYPRWQIIAIHF